MSEVSWVAAVLATWRVTHLIVAEDGPWNAVARVRRLAGASVLGEWMDCFYCASLWVAAPFGVWLGDGDWIVGVVAWLALSGGAIRLSVLASVAFPESCCYQLELRAYKRTIVDCQANNAHRNLSERSFQVTV